MDRQSRELAMVALLCVASGSGALGVAAEEPTPVPLLACGPGMFRNAGYEVCTSSSGGRHSEGCSAADGITGLGSECWTGGHQDTEGYAARDMRESTAGPTPHPALLATSQPAPPRALCPAPIQAPHPTVRPMVHPTPFPAALAPRTGKWCGHGGECGDQGDGDGASDEGSVAATPRDPQRGGANGGRGNGGDHAGTARASE